MNRESGLSLVETMISLSLLTLATGMMFMLFSGTSKQSNAQAKAMVNDQAAANFLTKLSRTYMGSEKIQTPKRRKLVLRNDGGYVTYETKCLKTENKEYRMPEEMIRCVKCRQGSIPTVTLTTKTENNKRTRSLSKQQSGLSPQASSICSMSDTASIEVIGLHI